MAIFKQSLLICELEKTGTEWALQFKKEKVGEQKEKQENESLKEMNGTGTSGTEKRTRPKFPTLLGGLVILS